MWHLPAPRSAVFAPRLRSLCGAGPCRGFLTQARSFEPADARTPSTTRSYHHATPHRRTRRAVRAGKVSGRPKPENPAPTSPGETIFRGPRRTGPAIARTPQRRSHLAGHAHPVYPMAGRGQCKRVAEGGEMRVGVVLILLGDLGSDFPGFGGGLIEQSLIILRTCEEPSS